MLKPSRAVIVAVLAAAVGTAAFAGDVTVGRFYSETAKAKHLVSADAASAEASLRAAGYQLPKLYLEKRLTEGDMTSIANALGVTITTSHPSQAVGQAQFSNFMTSFGSQIGAPVIRGGSPAQTNSQGDDPGNSGNSKGLKKGHHKSTSDPG